MEKVTTVLNKTMLVVRIVGVAALVAFTAKGE